MKLVKTFSLAAITAMVAMAFVGTTSTLGNTETVVLCKSAELACENPWPNPTTLTGHTVNTPLMLTNIGTITCEESSAEVVLQNELSEQPVGHISTFTLEGNCHLGTTACVVTVNELGGASAIHGPNPLEAIITAEPLPLEGAASMHTSANIKCGAFINCTYTLDGINVIATSNEAGELTLEANKTAMTNSKGFICPKIVEMDATYQAVDPKTFEPLTGLYIES